VWSLKRADIVCHGAGDVNLHVVTYKLTVIFVFCYCIYETKNYDKLSVFERNPLLSSLELAHMRVYVHRADF
jgi:hypothetical protein